MTVTGKINDLPPDPEEENEVRAARGKNVIASYSKATGTESEVALADLLADLMHLCDRDPSLGAFVTVQERAMDQYEWETRAG